MKNKLLAITALLMAMTLWSCDTEVPFEPYEPEWPEWPEDSSVVAVKKRVAIMGDSYSTFGGWSNRDVAGNPNDYYVYYPHICPLTGVDSVEKTWWYMLCQKPEFELEISNSNSGAVISNTHYGGVDVAGTDLSFMNRVGKNSFGVDYNGNPDVILVFGGTNDCWAGVELGKYVYENWSAADLKCFRPAFSKFLSTLQELYPDAIVLNITNNVTAGIPGLTKSIAESMQNICNHYGVYNIVLKDIEKVDGHPTYKGMQSICNQVYPAVRWAVRDSK